jgi:predicted  nucleic acid-binding Zn-ribbon protein
VSEASMPTSDDAVARLIDQIQAIALELDSLRKRGANPTELAAMDNELERLRWRLAASARRAARDDLGDAA